MASHHSIFILFLLTSSMAVTLVIAHSTAENSPTNADDYYPGETDSRAAAPPPETLLQPQLVECSNDSMRVDFGTACLKKAIGGGGQSQPTGSGSRISPAAATPNRPTPGRSRYFSVKPMLNAPVQKTANGVKSPALNARELYANKGYNFPVKSVKTVSGTSLRMYPHSPVNKYYSSKPQQPLPPSSRQPNRLEIPLAAALDPTTNNNEDDEWREADRETLVPLPIPAAEDLPPVPTGHHRPPVATRIPAKSYPSQSAPSGQYADELEMLQSLKRSLGVLGAQAMNLKQRSVLLYREARKRRLYFFDALLSRTHSFLGEKETETRNALADIDTAIGQINAHHEVTSASLANLRRTFYYYDQSASRPFTTRRLSRQVKQSKRKSKRASPPAPPTIDPKELDQLILDALNHAKRMMGVVRELNEALDEFEEQFNLPRFEPNTVVEDNAIDGAGKEEF